VGCESNCKHGLGKGPCYFDAFPNEPHWTIEGAPFSYLVWRKGGEPVDGKMTSTPITVDSLNDLYKKRQEKNQDFLKVCGKDPNNRYRKILNQLGEEDRAFIHAYIAKVTAKATHTDAQENFDKACPPMLVEVDSDGKQVVLLREDLASLSEDNVTFASKFFRCLLPEST
jgi:hypothetical protein